MTLFCKRCNRPTTINLGPSPDYEVMGQCLAGSDACEIIYRARRRAFLDGIAYIKKHLDKNKTVDWNQVDKELKSKNLI